MSALIRDAPFGQIVRYITNNRVFQYPEERPDFQLPAAYALAETKQLDSDTNSTSTTGLEEPTIEEAYQPDTAAGLEKVNTHSEDEDLSDLEKLQTIRTNHTARTQISRVSTRTALSKSISRADLDQQFHDHEFSNANSESAGGERVECKRHKRPQ